MASSWGHFPGGIQMTVKWSEVKVTQPCPTLATPWTIRSMEFSRPEYWCSLSLLQGIFPTQGSNPGLLHCRLILCQPNHKGSLRILEWVAYFFSSGSSWPRNQTGVSCIAGGFFTDWAIREALRWQHSLQLRSGNLGLILPRWWALAITIFFI